MTRRTLQTLARATAVVALAGAGLAATAGGASAAPAPTCPSYGAAGVLESTTIVRTGSAPIVLLGNPDRHFSGAVRPGDTVTVRFHAAPGCGSLPFTLASYRADLSLRTTDPARFLSTQELFQAATTPRSAAQGSTTLTVKVPTRLSPSAGPGCTNPHTASGSTYSGNGGPGPANPYASTCDGRASGNGNGGGAATGKPCAGCVGNADNRFPPGQAPGGSDANNGYECDGNSGIAKENPAHTGCTGTDGFQLDFYQGPVIDPLTSAGHPNVIAAQVG